MAFHFIQENTMTCVIGVELPLQLYLIFPLLPIELHPDWAPLLPSIFKVHTHLGAFVLPVPSTSNILKSNISSVNASLPSSLYWSISITKKPSLAIGWTGRNKHPFPLLCFTCADKIYLHIHFNTLIMFCLVYLSWLVNNLHQDGDFSFLFCSQPMCLATRNPDA